MSSKSKSSKSNSDNTERIKEYIETHIIKRFSSQISYLPSTNNTPYIIYTYQHENYPIFISHLKHIYDTFEEPTIPPSEQIRKKSATKKLYPVGFDCEYHPTTKVPTLIQISIHSICFIFSILKDSDIITDKLLPFIQNECIKIGVGVLDDIKALIEKYDLPKPIDNLLDLGQLSVNNKLFRSNKLVSLKHIGSVYLQIDNDKPREAGTFEVIELNNAAIRYAGLDAYIGYECLYYILQSVTKEVFTDYLEKYIVSSDNNELESLYNTYNINITKIKASNQKGFESTELKVTYNKMIRKMEEHEGKVIFRKARGDATGSRVRKKFQSMKTDRDIDSVLNSLKRKAMGESDDEEEEDEDENKEQGENTMNETKKKKENIMLNVV
ncbi:hypothetical protein ABK040_004961 [Willaertia magna]